MSEAGLVWARLRRDTLLLLGARALMAALAFGNSVALGRLAGQTLSLPFQLAFVDVCPRPSGSRALFSRSRLAPSASALTSAHVRICSQKLKAKKLEAVEIYL